MAPRKCYYEVLGVERSATAEELKKAYRKLAITLHPDKNPDREEEAKKDFQVLQEAYTVLSNPQDRAWYDEHRQVIIQQGFDFEGYEEDSIDLMPFCTSSCYKGFEDDEKGFYSVYRNLFEKIIAEELEASNEEIEIPHFGDSKSSHEEVVGPFYLHWEVFSTNKNFAWQDEYDSRKAGCRRVKRLMEQENKKIRSEARKDWNQRIRALVDFVKRKDKRYTLWKQEQDELAKKREAEIAKKLKEEEIKHIENRKKLLASAAASPKSNLNQNEILEHEARIANEYGDEENFEESDEEDPNFFHCIACNKNFNSERTFINHEKSKKHLTQVQLLKEQMLEDDEENEQLEDEEEKIISDEPLEEEDEVEEEEEEEIIEKEKQEDDEELEIQKDEKIEEKLNDLKIDDEKTNRQNKNKKSKVIKVIDKEDDEEEHLNDLLLKNGKDNSDDEILTGKNTKKKRRAKKEKEKQTNDSSESNVNIRNNANNNNCDWMEDRETRCTVCNENFPSRSKLFSHLKSSGHAIAVDSSNSNSNKVKNKSKGKSKSKK